MNEDGEENILERLIDDGGPALKGESTNDVVPDFNIGPLEESSTTKIGKYGTSIEDDVHLAEKTTITDGPKSKDIYRIAVYNGHLYDPSGPYSNHRKEKQLFKYMKFREVSKSVYDDYVQYLIKRTRNLYTKASRSFLND